MNIKQLCESSSRAELQHKAIARLATDEAIMSGDLPKVMHRLMEEAAIAIDVERASVWLINEAHDELQQIELYESCPKHRKDITILKRSYFPN